LALGSPPAAAAVRAMRLWQSLFPLAPKAVRRGCRAGGMLSKAPSPPGRSQLDTLTFIDHLVGHLAWPILIGLGVVLFRSSIPQLLDRVESLVIDAKGKTEIKFAKKIDQIEEQLLQRHLQKGLSTQTDVGVERTSYAVPYVAKLAATYFERLNDIPPELLVMEAWNKVERALIERAPNAGPLVDRYVKGRLSKDEIAVLDQLRELRNEVVHRGIKVSNVDAVRFATIVDTILSNLNNGDLHE
jgi:hypothetical protein